MQMFVASYESQELTEAEAKRRGWDGVSDGMLDYLCDSGERVSKKFPTKEEAQAWLVAEINAGKSVYGCGDIDVMLKMERRCRYCTCRGWKEVQSFLLDGDYLEEREVSDECWDGDE